MRAALRTELLAAISALSTGAAEIAGWKGDPTAFADGAVFPAVYVAYGGDEFGALEELGDPITYATGVHFLVYVLTADTESVDGEDQGLSLLETLETGLEGLVLASAPHQAPLELVDQQAIDAALGRYLYGQRYRLSLMQSR